MVHARANITALWITMEAGSAIAARPQMRPPLFISTSRSAGAQWAYYVRSVDYEVYLPPTAVMKRSLIAT